MQYPLHDAWAALIGDRYALRQMIGRGGMGEVWSADDLVLHRMVAVKLMHAQLTLDEVAQSRFQREVRAAASLNHPRVAAVYDAGWLPTAPPRPFLVMEYVSGHTAAERLRSAPPSTEEAVAWAAGTLEALACAHAAGLVHRDIKPANVMITTDGSVKVMDFGIAHISDGHDTSVTGTGISVGTTAYMSPEQAQGRPVDARSDLYSTGCMLYELLTGRQPFTGDSPFAIAYQHMCADPPAPRDLGVQLPPHHQAALVRAMAKSPDDRFPNAAAMRDALLAPESHDFAPSQDTTLAGAPTFPEEQATTALRSSRQSCGPQRTALAALALLGAGAVVTAVIAAAPDATHATGPQTSPSSSASASPEPEPSASGLEGTTHPGSGASPMSPRVSTEPTTPTVAVPGNLVGKTLAQARADLAELSLNIALTPRSSTAGTSTVITTIPSAGTQLKRGDTLLLATRTDTEAPASATPTSESPSTSPSASSNSPSSSASPTITGTGTRIPRPPIHR
ncbi:serine/threonine-protein kinase [Streptomyces sp. KhCrAH-43]|uniref:protein kinase domain-containing protein n=1 Tax=unclassified Streptomyces TaxID=2593676 RepID=UPI00036A04A4|nr:MULTISPECIES: protein kinase [unclassified Streptomyces]MYS33718.1 protein kinase [Streptomyces sp. SID4920]MYX68638.1 protein kinase [Streptomyces sp. SID8373]RAJ46767.1 serine/threonine-protein kinase [Streptomyces sp. KhCrAH-43]